MDPLIGSALIGAGSSLLGGIFDLFGSSDTNSANLQIARETNAQNKALFERQLGWNEEMWNKQNAYNTPAAQRARFEQAGINPYMALGNIQGGNAELQSSPTPPQMVGATMQRPDFSFIGRAGENMSNMMLQQAQIGAIKEQTRSQRIKNAFEERQQLADLEVKRSNAKKGSKEARLLEQEIAIRKAYARYADKRAFAEAQREENQAELVFQQEMGQILQNSYQQMYNEAFPKLNAQQLSMLAAQTYQAIQSGKLSYESSKVEQAKELGQILENGIKAGVFTLTDLGIPKAKLEALKAGLLNKVLEDDPGLAGILGWLEYFKQANPLNVVPIVPFGRGMK